MQNTAVTEFMLRKSSMSVDWSAEIFPSDIAEIQPQEFADYGFDK
jgi:hypothetical protein